MNPAGKLQILHEMVESGILSHPSKTQIQINEQYNRFYIPVLTINALSLPDELPELTYEVGFFNYNIIEIFESPLDTKLGKALYGK